MMFRIGGELEISPALLAGPSFASIPALPKPNAIWMDTGRSALYLALLDIIRRGGTKRAWLPAYVCGSVVTTFKALDFELQFYPVGSRLDASRFPDEIAKGDAFLYVHYFGHPNTAAVDWLKQVNYQGNFFVIEDCVQASLNSDVGAIGNYAITSYRKFLPQPDGALLGSNTPMESLLHEPDETFISAKFLGKLLRHETAQNKEAFLALFGEAEDRLEQGFMPRKMSWLSRYLMSRTDIELVSKKRRRNWHDLAKHFKSNPWMGKAMVPVFENLGDGAVPLGFPVSIQGGKRDSLRRHLADRHIYCPIHWELPHLKDKAMWREGLELSRAILTLPIDQRLESSHVTYMVQSIKTFFDGTL